MRKDCAGEELRDGTTCDLSITFGGTTAWLGISDRITGTDLPLWACNTWGVLRAGSRTWLFAGKLCALRCRIILKKVRSLSCLIGELPRLAGDLRFLDA